MFRIFCKTFSQRLADNAIDVLSVERRKLSVEYQYPYGIAV